jgi:DNA-binding response OmpR family regulator
MMEHFTILLVDDDPDILTILKDNLELDGYRVITAQTGKHALKAHEGFGPALVVLDLSLPDVDGIQVCRRIREESDVPILMLTARDLVTDKVLGLETGADDYMVKPFDYLELAARIKALLRRGSSFVAHEEPLEIGPLKVDPSSKGVWKDGKKIELTNREYALLLLLARNTGKVLSRTAIRHALWHERELSRDTRTIDVHVRNLRAKLEDDPGEPRLLVTVPGVGYMFAHPGA